MSAAEKSQGENETTSAPEKAIHEVQHLCQLAQLSRAGDYRHLAPRKSKRDDADIRDAIHRIALSDRFYGYRRIAEQLKREGLVVNSKRVRRLMRLDNLLSLRYKPFVPRTTDSAHGYEIVCDLTREAMLTAPDHIWVADITYIRLAEEFVYLAVVMDAFSRKVVGWALADHLQASLPLQALDKAIASRGGSLKDLIHHSDRGVQYACRDYALRLSQIGAHASMSRPGTPQDNAKAESFMHTLKAEEVDGKAYRSREDAESKIAPSSTTSTTPVDCIPRSAISRPLSSNTNSDKLRNVKQTNPRPCHRISRVSAEGRSPASDPRASNTLGAPLDELRKVVISTQLALAQSRSADKFYSTDR